MKIKQIEITDFGKFHNTTLDSLDQELVLIYGKNEAGKTTIFNLIKSIIFGFNPANRENHLYTSWENERIEFRATIVSQGEEIHLHRKLLSSPTGKMSKNDKLIDLRNSPLPFANHISWEIYNKIYSLRVEDLIEIQGKAWHEVQDKLLANYGNINIRSTRTVLKEIDEEVNQIYSSNSRRKTTAKELEGKIRELKSKKAEALEGQMVLKEKDKQIAKIEKYINQYLEEKILLKTQLKKAKVLLPIKKLLTEEENLKRKLNNHPLLVTLPHDGVDQLKELEGKKKDLQREIEKRKGILKVKLEKFHSFTNEEEKILAYKENIEEQYKGYLKLDSIIEERDQLHMETMKLKDRLNHEARNLLTGEIDQDISRKIKGLSIPELRLLITAHEKIKGEIKEVEGLQQYQIHQKKEIKVSNTYRGAVAIGLILLIVGLFTKQTPVLALGGVASIFGITDWLNGLRVKKQIMTDASGENNEDQLKKRKVLLAKELEEKRNALLQRFIGIPIPPLVLENIQELFLTNLIKVKDLIFELEEKTKILTEKGREIEIRHQNINDFLAQFHVDERGEGQQLQRLKNQAADLENQKATNKNMAETIEELEIEIKEMEAHYQQLEAFHKSINEKFLAIGDGEVDEGIRILQENRQLQLKIDLINEKLRELPDIENNMREIEENSHEDSWIFSDIEIERAEERLEELEEVLQGFKDEKKELEITIAQLMKETTVDEIASDIQQMETELDQLFFRRDRLQLLREIMAQAEEIFKEENQPDVLKNASHFLKLITGGIYTNIYLEEAEEETILLLKENNNPIPRRVSDGFSKGTLNQIYLALRLSLIDHLDKNGESLPIALDELLINWDEERLDNNLLLLKEISKKRQIFMFTCHDWFAKKIEATFHIRRIEINSRG